MPGRLVMDEQQTIGSQDLKKDRSQAQDGKMVQPSVSQAPLLAQANGLENHGPNGGMPNGVPAPEQPPPSTNGDLSTMSLIASDSANPPPLDPSWRQHDHNKPLGVLMERLAQKCFKDLNTTLTRMSEIPMQPQQHQPNGVMPHVGEDTSDGSLQKKRLLMEFAKEQRDGFIKTLVLSDWCKNEEEQGRLIDVKVWQDVQGQAQTMASRAIAQTKANMGPAKVPNPNIEDAMELLATSKASWLSDLGYIPSKRLSAKQLLKTLRNMNVVLAARLNLFEDLPPHMQDFTIADGRATFTVNDEFEVDLSVADEDPATPFYFIDIRLLFTPASNILDDRLRGFMEAKVNQELSTKGLRGCYDFLHNFMLTHKINVLRSQAAEMIRGKWFDCIRTENLRRNFVVQYWPGMPGPKSWIEIGITSGREKHVRSRHNGTPRISVRWFRKGVEVKDEALEFEWRHLNLERCVEVVIRKHTGWILADLRQRVRSSTGVSDYTTVEVSNLQSTSATPTLSLNQPPLREPLQVNVEPITGKFAITPASRSTAHAEGRLNNDPQVDPVKWLAWLVCIAAQERTTKVSELLGWMSTPKIRKQDNLQKVFGEAVRHISVYTPSTAWGSTWSLAVTFSLTGQKWWAVSLDERVIDQSGATGKIITSAHHIPDFDAPSDENVLSPSSLIRIERRAVAEVTFGALSKQLSNMRIPYNPEDFAEIANGPHDASRSRSSTMTTFVQFSGLMKSSSMKSWKPWAADLMRLTHYGIADDTSTDVDQVGSVRHDLRLTLQPGSLRSLQKYLSLTKDRNLILNSSNGMALRFYSPFGEPFVEQMRKRLQSVERLDRYVAILQKRGLKCSQVSLSRLAFTYNDSPELSAQLDFSKAGGLPARVTLLPASSNAQSPIRFMLERGLNDEREDNFEMFAFLLRFTLPVWRTLEQLEVVNSARRCLVVHPRSAMHYLLSYRMPLPSCDFQLMTKTKHEGGKAFKIWHLEKVSTSNGNVKQEDDAARYPGLPDDLVKSLNELWQSKGKHWEGVGSGIVAEARGVEDALRRVDAIMRRSETSDDITAKSEVDGKSAPADVVKSETGTTTNSQPQPQTTPAATDTVKVKSDPDVIMID